jgi:hypothetical protein
MVCWPLSRNTIDDTMTTCFPLRFSYIFPFTAAALLAVGLRESVDPGILGLAIVYAISLSGILQLMVRKGPSLGVEALRNRDMVPFHRMMCLVLSENPGALLGAR